MNLEIGSTVGDYQIIGMLGAGGMGKVYKVRSVISDRIEAMKVLLPDLANAPELADRFVREIKVQASLEHPNIAALHTAVRVDNQLLMLMEFVEGITLEQKLASGPLPVAGAVEYIGQVLAALEYAHGRGVVHRDIKPANMILTPAGIVKLMDFGIARAANDQRLTMTGTTMGSLYYMSPEQIQGAANVDARSDLYSVGVSLYELVTGKRPFDGDSQFAIMSAHLEKTPVPPIVLDPKLPQPLNDLILMAVAKSPEARFQTAGAFRTALGAVVSVPSVPAAAASAASAAPARAPEEFRIIEPTMPERPGARRGLWMGIGAVAAVGAILALVQFGPWRGTKAAQDKPPVEAPAPQPSAPSAPLPVSGAPDAARPEPASASTQPVAAEPAGSFPPVAAAPRKRETRVASAPPSQRQQQPPVTAAQAPPATSPSSPPAPAPAPVQPAATPQKAAPGPSRAELQEVRERLVMLGTRAGAARGSLDTLERSQAASGLNLRADIREAANLMGSYLEGANAALRAGDSDSAKNFMEKAERQIEKLEKFLGR